MSRVSLLNALVQLHRMEREQGRAGRGGRGGRRRDGRDGQGWSDGAPGRDGTSDGDIAEVLGLDEDTVDCAKGTGMALLHLPVKTTMDLAWLAVAPVLTAYFVLYGSILHAFLVYLGLRVGLWGYDAAMLRHAKRAGHVPYNSSWVSTLLGTFPYRGNTVVGPGLNMAMDALWLLPFSGVLGLSSLGVAGSALEAGAVSFSILTVTSRYAINSVILVEMQSGADRALVRTALRSLQVFESAATALGRVIVQVPAALRRTARRARARVRHGALAGARGRGSPDGGTVPAAGTTSADADPRPPDPWRDKALHVRSNRRRTGRAGDTSATPA